MLFWLTGRYFVLEAHDPHCDGTGRSPSALSFSAAQILLHCHILWHDRGKERRPHHGNNKPSDTSQHRLMVILREAYHLYIFFISGNILALDEWMWRVFTSPWLAQRRVLKIGCVFTVFLMIVTAIKKQKKTKKKTISELNSSPHVNTQRSSGMEYCTVDQKSHWNRNLSKCSVQITRGYNLLIKVKMCDWTASQRGTAEM